MKQRRRLHVLVLAYFLNTHFVVFVFTNTTSPADGGKILQDENRLSSYGGITDGCILLLVALLPFEIYVTGADGRMHTITVKSSQPEVRALQCLYAENILYEELNENYPTLRLM